MGTIKELKIDIETALFKYYGHKDFGYQLGTSDANDGEMVSFDMVSNLCRDHQFMMITRAIGRCLGDL